MITDLQALERYRGAEDADALAVLVERHREMVYAVCRRRLSVPDAEDATQETFLKLIRNAHQVKTSVGAWLHTVAATTAIDAGRKITRTRRDGGTRSAHLDGAEAPQEDVMDEVELRAELDDAVTTLDESLRSLVIEHYLVGRTQTELAAECGCSVPTISRRLSGALDVLRAQLNKKGFMTATAGGVAALLESQARAGDLPAGLMLRVLGAIQSDATPAAAGTGGGGAAPSRGDASGSADTHWVPWHAGGAGWASAAPALLGATLAVGLGWWMLASPTPPVLPLRPAAAPPLAAGPEANNPDPTSLALRVGWVLNAPAEDDASGRSARINQITQVVSRADLDVTLLLPETLSPSLDSLLRFVGPDIKRRVVTAPDALAGMQVVVVGALPADPADAAGLASRAAAAWRSGTGLVWLVNAAPDDPSVRDMLMARTATPFHHPGGHNQRMSAAVTRTHPVLGGLAAGAALDVCGCGLVMDVHPTAQVVAVRDPAGMPLAEQAAAAGIDNASLPLILVDDPAARGADAGEPGTPRPGRRVVAPMTDTRITAVGASPANAAAAATFLERAIRWSGGRDPDGPGGASRTNPFNWLHTSRGSP